MSLLNVGTFVGAGAGFLTGAFTPAIGRKLKSLFVRETTAAKTAVSSAAQGVATGVASAATRVAKKV